MNPREKTLAIAVGGLLALAGLWATIKLGVVDRWHTLHNRIEQARVDTEKTRKRLDLAKAAEADWSALRPLAHNADRAGIAFRQDINELLDKNGLHEDFTIGPLPQRKLKNEFTEVRLSIRARGHLQQVVNFLCDFYERGYLARLDQINLTADEKSASASRAPAASTPRSEKSGRSRRSRAGATTPEVTGGAEGPMLNISIVATALVLPQLKVGGATVPQPQGCDEGAEPLERLPRPREQYAQIWETNIFKLYQERPPPPPVEKELAVTPVDPVEKDTKPQPPARPNKAVTGVTSTFGKLAVFVRDRDDLGAKPEKIEINGAVDDGTLVLVTPDGMVVQVPSQQGGGSMKYYFYKLGWDHSFADREELDPNEYPEIQAQLSKALSS